MKIEVQNVSKQFGRTFALDHVSLTLEENRIYGLFGNNGAGKSTLLGLITNRLYPTEGNILVDGQPVADNDRILGRMFLMGEQNLYPDDMRVIKAFRTAALFYPDFNLDLAVDLAHQFGLETKKKITALSTGYASIFRLVIALSVNTPVLFLDEPVLGLDAQHRDLFYRLLMKKYAEHPCTILISTHIMQEITDMLDHVLILRGGRLVKNLPVEDLLAGVYTVSGPTVLMDQYLSTRTPLSVHAVGGLKSACLQQVDSKPQPVEGLTFAPADLQTYFISLMNEEDA